MMNGRCYGARFVNAAENEQLYKTDLPEADIPPEVLIALLGIKEETALYDLD